MLQWITSGQDCKLIASVKPFNCGFRFHNHSCKTGYEYLKVYSDILFWSALGCYVYKNQEDGNFWEFHAMLRNMKMGYLKLLAYFKIITWHPGMILSSITATTGKLKLCVISNKIYKSTIVVQQY